VERLGPQEVTVLSVKRVTMALRASRGQRATVDRQVRRELLEIRALKVRAGPVARLASTVLLASLERRVIVARRGRLGQPETRAHRARVVLVARLAQQAVTVPAVRRAPQAATVQRAKRVMMARRASQEQRETVVRLDQPVRPETRARRATAGPVARLVLREATVLRVKQVTMER
jgi:hypothetical protein